MPQVNCKRCEGKGYVEYETRMNNGWYPQLRQCSECKNIEGYSREVQRRYAQKPLTQKPFEKLSLVKQ